MEQPEVKVATRNMFYDEQGKHRRTKKEVLDEQGNLRAIGRMSDIQACAREIVNKEMIYQ